MINQLIKSPETYWQVNKYVLKPDLTFKSKTQTYSGYYQNQSVTWHSFIHPIFCESDVW